ncbi:hypothetical protein BMG03_13900 [Thioclava nitratireducens]|uniref:Uncharacterized protein n=1 Tax=Thioclava nitratireducens TaxID=1915078 RepID=A0ABM6IIU3_9RHOB|nr:hypothetical protein BMG03_13900 [Thioclava nitratireducens]
MASRTDPFLPYRFLKSAEVSELEEALCHRHIRRAPVARATCSEAWFDLFDDPCERDAEVRGRALR